MWFSLLPQINALKTIVYNIDNKVAVKLGQN